ncbi:MAG: hypothetical protein IIB36_16980 [Gemmatimonadetes bacterium]|nr:hypothetical protein [Gemmatimonadota bacterium]
MARPNPFVLIILPSFDIRTTNADTALFQAAPIGPIAPAVYPAVRQFTTLE